MPFSNSPCIHLCQIWQEMLQWITWVTNSFLWPHDETAALPSPGHQGPWSQPSNEWLSHLPAGFLTSATQSSQVASLRPKLAGTLTVSSSGGIPSLGAEPREGRKHRLPSQTTIATLTPCFTDPCNLSDSCWFRVYTGSSELILSCTSERPLSHSIKLEAF